MRLEWDSDPISDMIADSVVAVILQADCSPASVKGLIIIYLATKSQHSHSHNHKADGCDIVKLEPLDGLNEVSASVPNSAMPVAEVALDDIEIISKNPKILDGRNVKLLDLPKTAKLEDLVTNFLSLQFGEDRVINLSPLLDPVMESSLSEAIDSTIKRKFLWSLKVDSDEATVTIDSDGASWVIFFQI